MQKLILLAIILCTGISKAQNLNGVWADSSSSSFDNCYAVFALDGDSVFMTHYIEFNGKPFIEYGRGIKKGNEIIYSVKVTQQIPGWSTTAGLHTLMISKDGQTLRGSYKDNVGNTGPLVFKRLFPKNTTGTEIESQK